MIKVFWANQEKTVVQIDYFEPVASWEEYRNATAEAYELVKSQAHPVHLIHNPGKAQMPKGNAIGEIQRALANIPRNVGMIATLIANPVARRIVEVTAKLYLRRKHFYVVSSLEEAYQRLEEVMLDKA